MLTERDREFAIIVLNASLTLMSIFVAVIALLAVEYKRVQPDERIAEPIHKAIIGTTWVSFFAGAMAFISIIQLRSGRWSPLAVAFEILIAITASGIVIVAYSEGLL